MKNEIDEILDDPKRYCEECLKIRNKEGKEQFLVFNETQKKVYERILKLKSEGKPIRLVILKARQQGISTLTEGLILHDTATRENRNSLIVSHDPESTKAIFKMSKFFYENLPSDVRPMKRYSNKAELVFENPDEKARLNPDTRGLGSQIEVATAAKTEMRSRTIHNFHASELGFWTNAEDLMIAAMQMIPDSPDTMVILESTPNGVGGYFYDMYWNAKSGKNDFEAIFLPWFTFKEYSRTIYGEFILNEDEKRMKEAFSLTDQQLNWRRWCIANNCGGDELKFKQEYGSTDRECFIVSGTPRFNTLNLSIYHDNIPQPKYVGELVSEDTPEAVKTPEIHAFERGRLKIYQWPKIEHSYVIGGDTAKGTEWSDYSCLQVLDKHTGDQVAVWHGKIDPTKLAYLAARLGYFYRGGQNCALIGIEVNKDGITTNKVLHSEIAYPKLYRRRTVDRTTEKNEMKLGFHTNERSRELILNKLARWINEGEFALVDETTIMECMTFVYDENGKCQGQQGCYDDCFVKGTMILTDKGQVSIENIRRGDMVMTRDGYRPVVMTRSRVKDIISNLGLTGTPDHPVITVQGEKCLANVKDSDILYIWNQSKEKIEKLSYIEAKGIIDTQSQKKDNLGFTIGGTRKKFPIHCIDRFGLIIMEKYRKAMLSIIKIIIPSTIALETYRYSKRVNMPLYTCLLPKDESNLGKQGLNRLKESRKLLVTGGKKTPILQKQSIERMALCKQEEQPNHLGNGKNRILIRLKNYVKKVLAFYFMIPLSKLSVFIAKRFFPIRQKGVENIVQGFAPIKSAVRNKLQKINWKENWPKKKERVYNLQVADTPEYFANSILVHNCVISLSIAIHLFDYNVKIEPPKTDIEKLRIGMKQKKLQVNW